MFEISFNCERKVIAFSGEQLRFLLHLMLENRMNGDPCSQDGREDVEHDDAAAAAAEQARAHPHEPVVLALPASVRPLKRYDSSLQAVS